MGVLSTDGKTTTEGSGRDLEAPPSGLCNIGGRDRGGGDLYFPPPEHIIKVHRNLISHGNVPIYAAAPCRKGLQ